MTRGGGGIRGEFRVSSAEICGTGRGGAGRHGEVLRGEQCEQRHGAGKVRGPLGEPAFMLELLHDKEPKREEEA